MASAACVAVSSYRCRALWRASTLSGCRASCGSPCGAPAGEAAALDDGGLRVVAAPGELASLQAKAKGSYRSGFLSLNPERSRFLYGSKDLKPSTD